MTKNYFARPFFDKPLNKYVKRGELATYIEAQINHYFIDNGLEYHGPNDLDVSPSYNSDCWSISVFCDCNIYDFLQELKDFLDYYTNDNYYFTQYIKQENGEYVECK